VDRPLTFEDDVRLPALGLALTNIVARPTRGLADLRPADFARGRRRLAAVIARLRPEVVAFVGATVYRAFAGPAAPPGCGARPERLAGARVFVVPNPSGRNAAYPGFRDKLAWYRRLRRFAAGTRGSARPTARRR
jgi:TDG/mug DNA glycosylase family protein